MSDCKETLRDLYPFLDGELSEDVRVHVAEHLDACTDCLEAFDFEAELKAAIRRKASNDEIPAGLIARLESCLELDFTGDSTLAEPSDPPAP